MNPVEERLRGDEDVAPVGPLTGPIMLTLPDPTGGFGEPAGIREVATGRLIRKIPKPRGVELWTAAAGIRDNRTFFLLGSLEESEQRLYRLRVDDMGRIAELSPLPQGDLPAATGEYLAASSDGGTLAVNVDTSKGPDQPRGEIWLLRLATGRWDRWPAAAVGIPQDLSLSADGSTLAFAWWQAAENDGLYVLDLGDPKADHDLIKAGRRLAPNEGERHGELSGARLDAGGDNVFAVARSDRTRLLKIATKEDDKYAVYLERPNLPETQPGSGGGGPTAADSGAPIPAFSLDCAAGDLRHLMLTSRDASWWMDTKTREMTKISRPADSIGRVIC